MIVKTTLHHLTAVQTCVAPSTDPRNWLRGWHVDTVSPRGAHIVGSDGYRAIAVPVEVVDGGAPMAPKENIFAPAKLPKRQKNLDVLIDTEKLRVIIPELGMSLDTRTITGKFPDCLRLMQGPLEHNTAQKEFGIDFSLVAPVQAALQEKFAVLKFGPTNLDLIRVFWNEPGNREIIFGVMPCMA